MVQSTHGNKDVDSSAVSVRALLSRFETVQPSPGQGHRSRPCIRSGSISPSQPCSRSGSIRLDDNDYHQITQQRTRSKSESFSRKPKSVLKNKKNKSWPRKSVTFADSIASGYESAWELNTPHFAHEDRAYHSDDEDHLVSHSSYSDNDLDDVEDTGSSNSDESPLGQDDQACQLCSKRRVEERKLFCAKCSFYMGKLTSN